MMRSPSRVAKSVLEHDLMSARTFGGIGQLIDLSPCGFRGGDTNLYRYVDDDPTSLLDPLGERPSSTIGPKGSGTADNVPPDDPLPYTIDFTNVPAANAPKGQTILTDELDPELDWQTFRLGSFGFGGPTFTVPEDDFGFFNTVPPDYSGFFNVAPNGWWTPNSGFDPGTPLL